MKKKGRGEIHTKTDRQTERQNVYNWWTIEIVSLPISSGRTYHVEKEE